MTESTDDHHVTQDLSGPNVTTSPYSPPFPYSQQPSSPTGYKMNYMNDPTNFSADTASTSGFYHSPGAEGDDTEGGLASSWQVPSYVSEDSVQSPSEVSSFSSSSTMSASGIPSIGPGPPYLCPEAKCAGRPGFPKPHKWRYVTMLRGPLLAFLVTTLQDFGHVFG